MKTRADLESELMEARTQLAEAKAELAQTEAYIAGVDCTNEKLRTQLAELAEVIHYPRCWDTAAYPTLLSAITEIGCECKYEQPED